ncbi:MAG: DUF2855 family protein [Pseudomonadota bacterium]
MPDTLPNEGTAMQFQVRTDDITRTRLVEAGTSDALGEGEVRVAVDRFGFSANNITYAAAGFSLGYWKFFLPHGSDTEGWGVLPVWGFADVVESACDEVAVGERLFGYFPPARHLVLQPKSVSAGHFIDGAAHRSELPTGYNLYRRVPASTPATEEDHHMLLYPLYVTSYALWDLLKENDWFGAQRVVLTSASSKTSIGLAYALKTDPDAPAVTGLTSASNVSFVQSLGLYDDVLSYDDLASLDASVPTAIVDMAGNGAVLGAVHAHLSDSMVQTLQVGLTHWDNKLGDSSVIKERSTFFFAPSQIQKRLKDWGPVEFEGRSQAFLTRATGHTKDWLTLKHLNGLDDLAAAYGGVCAGSAAPDEGLIVHV